MRNIIIGSGEVGNSLYEVLKNTHETFIRDLDPLPLYGVEVMNICFPPDENFDEAVKNYQAEYKPKLTIIHSSVPVGTSRRLGAVHSPIHGKHPNLAEGIKTFVKYVGGSDSRAIKLAVKFLKASGIRTKIVSSPEASELSKLICTTRYGWEIVFMKEIEKLCKELNVSFNEVYGWSKYYNKGYKKLGMPHFMRSMLTPMPGRISGHCVIPNAHILKDTLDMEVAKIILDRNETF